MTTSTGPLPVSIRAWRFVPASSMPALSSGDVIEATVRIEVGAVPDSTKAAHRMAYVVSLERSARIEEDDD